MGSLLRLKKNNFEISAIYIRGPFGPLRALLIYVILKSVHVGGVPDKLQKEEFPNSYNLILRALLDP